MTTLTNARRRVQAGDLSFTFWDSGDLFQAVSGKVMINQLMLSPLDGSLNNIYLRIHSENGIEAYPLLGIHSDSHVYQKGNCLEWTGTVRSIAYTVTFAPTDQGVWFWEVTLQGEEQKVDVIYGQDVGIADTGAVRSNEAYLSQYIDHTVFEDAEKGYVVCSRQNQPQGGTFPYLQQGSLTGAAGYSTDGFQFYGLTYKETNIPEALQNKTLANEVYQYEFAYTALQSEQTVLAGEASFVFYGLFRPHHEQAITELEYKEVVDDAWNTFKSHKRQNEKSSAHKLPDTYYKPQIGKTLAGRSLTDEEVDQLFPAAGRHEVEYKDGQLLAFFTDTYEHVVLKSKEMLVERPHGHILMSGNNVKLGAEVLTTTSYMYGIFNSHVVVGNTNFNKLMSNSRSALNIPKTSGQRIYIELDGEYRLLTMASLFEIGFNYVRWYYKLKDDMLVITNFTSVDRPEVQLQVRSESGNSYRYLVSNQMTMNVNEYEVPVHYSEKEGKLIIKADSSAVSHEVYPELSYTMWMDGAELQVHDETCLAEGIVRGDASLTVLQISASHSWTLTMQGLLDGKSLPSITPDFMEEKEKYREFFRSVMNGFHLKFPDSERSEALFKVNSLAWWYTHNMLVHYSVPHGLEQYGGAAWGTRDVCQGPVEYFMATQKYEQVRDILKMVYAHQYEDDGNWPQWFMFDQYNQIQQEESHGDIIVWPLKVLSDYLNATQDYGILDERVPYTLKHSFDFTEDTSTILEHVQKEIGYIQSHFLHDTYLSSYGDGDWDDTLQPANAQLKQYMVSSWTVALTYQTLRQLSQAMKSVQSTLAQELLNLSEGIKRDFQKYMLNTNVIPGFIYMENLEDIKPMLHPSDEETGIQYRLLPMTRSMIAELLSPEQAKSHYELIKTRLFCPDGVRLMNRPAVYAGGVSTHFKRAEQASNFGREVGLQYVHAHIRYVEAMAKLGYKDEVWSGLGLINPIGITKVVPNAELRQSNVYFSSSDGKFSNRYEAQERFDELRAGKVKVKGGWRIYSSGPGIYMNQLISNALGIRQDEQDLIIDPVLPSDLDGMEFDFEIAGKRVTFVYHLGDHQSARIVINGRDAELNREDHPYRVGGVRIERHVLDSELNQQLNVIDVYM
ncbi:amylo-alpha-1,6-glucosidase [Paenibacillus shunpengii]|uniref:Amylo-alpha-1,6-glucosidase n=1 Tax=Paenibacillus shunpengii TaxID=2054424 RepID=A0ABW5SJZ4_9BACL